MTAAFTQKHVVVTGGTRGIGRATVLGFAQQGARVSTCYASRGKATDALEQELADVGGPHYLAQTDVRNEADVNQFIVEAQRRCGPIDVLVNNAGVVSHRPLTDLDLAEWQRVLDVNLTGMYLVTRAASAFLSDAASIVNVTSAVATRGMAARVHYTAAKAGVVGLTRSLCKELAPRGIRVNAVAPGLVATDQMSGVAADAAARYTTMIPLGRFATPEEIAEVVIFLGTSGASYVNGATIHVDGGI